MAGRKGRDTSVTRNRFEAFLKDYDAEAYREYVRVKKEAIAKGADPVREFRDVLTNTPGIGREVAERFWLNAIGKRLVSTEDADVQFLRDAFVSKRMDLDSLAEFFGGNRKKAADIICALKLPELENAGYSSVYMIVDKLIKGRGSRGPRSAPEKILLDEIPEELIEGNVDALEILKRYGIEEWQRAYQIDYDQAEAALEKRIAECQEPAKKSIYQDIHDAWNLQLP